MPTGLGADAVRDDGRGLAWIWAWPRAFPSTRSSASSTSASRQNHTCCLAPRPGCFAAGRDGRLPQRPPARCGGGFFSAGAFLIFNTMSMTWPSGTTRRRAAAGGRNERLAGHGPRPAPGPGPGPDWLPRPASSWASSGRPDAVVDRFVGAIALAAPAVSAGSVAMALTRRRGLDHRSIRSSPPGERGRIPQWRRCGRGPRVVCGGGPPALAVVVFGVLAVAALASGRRRTAPIAPAPALWPPAPAPRRVGRWSFTACCSSLVLPFAACWGRCCESPGCRSGSSATRSGWLAARCLAIAAAPLSPSGRSSWALAMVVALGTAAQDVRRSARAGWPRRFPGSELLTSIRPVFHDGTDSRPARRDARRQVPLADRLFGVPYVFTSQKDGKPEKSVVRQEAARSSATTTSSTAAWTSSPAIRRRRWERSTRAAPSSSRNRWPTRRASAWATHAVRDRPVPHATSRRRHRGPTRYRPRPRRRSWWAGRMR